MFRGKKSLTSMNPTPLTLASTRGSEPGGLPSTTFLMQSQDNGDVVAPLVGGKPGGFHPGRYLLILRMPNRLNNIPLHLPLS